ncbi:IMPACT family protein [Kaistella polysaccharea]|uniref:IMPACT family protein n=1 Tax=Kaistella polysaccharea TaxID=2878534 RepID=UPI001CF39C6F|nr:YigZ family protein [Kaistella polysaccharea]
MEFSFDTIKTPVDQILLREKGSKFIGFAFPVRNDFEIKESLNKIKEIHPKATHHCYAFRLGVTGENYRANDDGEPSGSAGSPIYNQLLAHNVTNILVIVVRYYGGTKLGVSGLVRAYKETAKVTLESSEIITEELKSELLIQFPFTQQNVIFTLLNKFEAKILDFTAEEKCSIKARLKTAEKENISDQLAEMQNISFEFLN